MSFSIGIVGLPNVGKSTLFKALTKKQIDIANYPFCTIEPNKGIVAVPDERLDKLAVMSASEKIIYTTIEFVDIAGLVAGAAKGEGLGNKFLAHIREVDAICHVVRGFAGGEIIHVANRVDPAADQEVINMELALADLETVTGHLTKIKSKLKGTKGKELADAQKMIDLLEKKIIPALEQGRGVRLLALIEEEKELLRHLSLLTAKPVIYILNVAEAEVSAPATVAGLENEVVIPVCAKIEAELAELTPADAREFMDSLGLAKSGLDRIITEAYRVLNLISFLTTGEKETRAWTIERETKAPQAAGKIHTDFERGFIAVEVIDWQKLLETGSEARARERGWLRLEGKDYVMEDGDVCNFRFNV